MLTVLPEAKPSLIGMDASELSQALGERPDARWRGKQIAQWIYGKAVADLQGMCDLPQTLRNELAEKYLINPLHVARHVVSTDGVEKLLVHNGDGNVFECVLLPYED